MAKRLDQAKWDKEFFSPSLKELGSYYNSQHLAHVGYLLVVTALIFQLVLQFFSKDFVLSLPVWIPTAFASVLFAMLFFGLLYFLGRTQLYSVYSQTVWDLQGIQESEIKDAVLAAIDKKKVSVYNLVVIVSHIRLLASKREWSQLLEKYGSNNEFWTKDGLTTLKETLKNYSFHGRSVFGVPLTLLLPIALIRTREQLGKERREIRIGIELLKLTLN